MVTSRILFTAKQKDELWERWKNGQSVLAISRALERRNKTCASGGNREASQWPGIALPGSRVAGSVVAASGKLADARSDCPRQPRSACSLPRKLARGHRKAAAPFDDAPR